MKLVFKQLVCQFILLQKNQIISISMIVTVLYGIILFFLKDFEFIDKILVTLVLIDPTIIGYFFIALIIYTEMKHQLLSAIFVAPINIHKLLIAKIMSLSIIGAVCSLGLVISVKGLDFSFIHFTIGSFGICLLSALLALIVLTKANEFLKFAMISLPVFIVAINISQLQYLGAIDIGHFKYMFPIQGCTDLIDYSVSGTNINFVYAYMSLIILVPAFYLFAFKAFKKKIMRQ